MVSLSGSRAARPVRGTNPCQTHLWAWRNGHKETAGHQRCDASSAASGLRDILCILWTYSGKQGISAMSFREICILIQTNFSAARGITDNLKHKLKHAWVKIFSHLINRYVTLLNLSTISITCMRRNVAFSLFMCQIPKTH